jgi:hypothetical protein
MSDTAGNCIKVNFLLKSEFDCSRPIPWPCSCTQMFLYMEIDMDIDISVDILDLGYQITPVLGIPVLE